MPLQKQYDPAYLKSALGADDVEKYAPSGLLPTDNIDQLKSMFGGDDIDALLGAENKPPDAPSAPMPDGGGGPASAPMQGLQMAMGQVSGPTPGWENEPATQQTAQMMGNRTPPQAVTTLSDVMRRFGRTY